MMFYCVNKVPWHRFSRARLWRPNVNIKCLRSSQRLDSLRNTVHRDGVLLGIGNSFSTSGAGAGSKDGVLHFQIADAQALLNAVACSYSSMERILMEYVDNSIDDINRSKSKSFVVKVFVDIDEDAKTIWIRDNCRGMNLDGLTRIISGVGKSLKRGVGWQNGQFGFGMHSFRAAAQKLHVFSIPSGSRKSGSYITLDRDQQSAELPLRFHLDKLDSSIVQSAKTSGVFSHTQDELFFDRHGTCVALENIDDSWFSNLKARKIAREVENHFEVLLREGKVEVNVTEFSKVRGKLHPNVNSCTPFEYPSSASSFQGTLVSTSPSGKKLKLKYDLFVANDPGGRSKDVCFFRKGRRVSRVEDTKSYMEVSKHKRDLWSSPLLYGVVQVPDELDPVITRDEFMRNEDRDATYSSLVSLETDLMDSIQSSMDNMSRESMSDIEDILGRAIDSAFDRVWRSNRRKTKVIQDSVMTKEKEEPNVVTEDGKKYPRASNTANRKNRHKPIRHKVRMVSNKDPNSKRSFFQAGTIFINIDHRHFTERLPPGGALQSNVNIGSRLPFLLSNEIAQYCVEERELNLGLPEPNSKEEMYERLFDSAMEFETRLSKLRNLRLSTLQAEDNEEMAS